jgi:ArsR family metal-binding transcriptional regulator
MLSERSADVLNAAAECGSISPMARSTVVADELKVFITHRESKCDECGEALGSRGVD